MKKSYKILIIIASVAILLGLILGTVVLLNSNINFKADHVENTYTFATDGIKKISVNAKTQDIKITSGNVDEIVIYARENEWEKYDISTNGDTFSITANDSRKWFEKLFNFSQRRWEYDLEVILPENFVGADLAVSLTTGDIDLASLDLQEFSLKLSTGDVGMSRINAKNVTVNLTTGDFEAYSVDAQGFFLKLSTGDIDLSSLDILGKAEISATTGDIELSDVKSDELYVSTRTGDTELSNVKSDELYISTRTGDIDMERVYANRHDVKTKTGDIEGRVQDLEK